MNTTRARSRLAIEERLPAYRRGMRHTMGLGGQPGIYNNADVGPRVVGVLNTSALSNQSIT
jgi:hypothetical protein